MVCTYGSFARDLTALNAGVSVAAVPGGSLTAGQTLWIAVQIRTRGGLTLHTTPVQVTTTEANTAIAVTLAASAIATGDYPMEMVVSGAATNDVTAMVRLASWRFRDGLTLTYTGVGAVVYPGEGALRELPATLTLTQDAHLLLSGVVATAAALPTGADLIHGMLRQISATSEVVRYDSEAVSGLYAAGAGYWQLHLPGFTPTTNGNFSTYFGVRAELEGGCDRLVTELGPGQAINLPAYRFDGSVQDPPLVLFLNNGFESGAGSPLPKGGSMAIQIKMNDSDVSSAFAGRISLQLMGYCDRETGVLDTEMAGSAIVWQPGTNAIVLPEDLPRGSAAVYQVALAARVDEIVNNRDVNASALADGAVLTTMLYFEGSLGRPSDLWYFLGDVVFAIADRMVLVPLVNGLRRLGGVALVKGYGTALVGTYLVDGVTPDTAGQKAAISGALNGAILMREPGEALGETEALRATISTAAGTQSPSDWSAPVALASSNRTITVSVTSPTAIRDDYPDLLISGNDQGENNVAYYRVFVEAPGGAIYELTAPMAVSPTGTTLIVIDSMAALSAGSLPVQNDESFGLFGYGAISGSATAGGSLEVGTYRVAVANYYPASNNEVTAISHGGIEILGASVSDLLNQSLPYARLSDSFVQPAVASSVTVAVDNARVFGVGGSALINTVGNVFQGSYSITAKTDTTLTLVNLGASGSVAPGVTVPASGYVFPAGSPGPAGAAGSTIHSSPTNPPDPILGALGDYALTSTDPATLFGPKVGAGWGTGMQLVGDPGADGQPGLGLRYSPGVALVPPPTSGQLLFNDASLASVTEIYVSTTARTGVGVGSILNTLTAGSKLLIFDEFSDAAFAFYQLVALTDNTTYITLSVAHEGSGAAAFGENISLGFSVAGGQGDPGVAGRTILPTTGAPGAELGEDGDFALDTAASLLYGPKTAGAWESPVSIKGDPGPAGSVTAASGLTLEPIATPAAPVTGSIVYTKADNLLYYRPAAGDETPVGVTSVAFDDLTSTPTTLAGYGITDAAPITSPMGTLTYAATVDLDMATLNGSFQTISLTGDLTFTTSNRVSGRETTLRLLADATLRTLTFPAGWRFVGTKPANIAASKVGILTVKFFGTADTDCVAAWGVEA